MFEYPEITPEKSISDNLQRGLSYPENITENISAAPSYSKIRRFPWEYAGMAFLVIAMLTLHFLVISRPPTIVWDETWYVNDAKSIIAGEGDLRVEHPALAKLFIITGIHLFGDNAFGWRFFSVIFGTACIPVFFFICRKLRMSGRLTLLATFLFALDDMFFVHSSLALLDIYMLFFTLLGLLFYLQKGYLLTGMTFAISALCKTTGVFGFIAVLIHWLLFRRDESRWFLKMIGSALAAVIAYLSSDILFEYFIQGKLVDPLRRTIDMLNSNAANVFTNPPLSISSRPWEWIYPWKIIVYAYGVAPEPQYISFISWTIQLLIVPIFGYLIYKAMKHNTAARFALIWFIVSFLTWIPLDIVTNRVTYVFYFLPTAGAVCIGIALALNDIIFKLKDRTVRYGRITSGTRATYIVIALYLLLHLAIFIIFNPNFPTIIKFWLPPFVTSG